MDVINLKSKHSAFSDHWSPKIVGELNGQYVKLVKFQGEYVWHHHEQEDEMFLVLAGSFDMHYREPAPAAAPAESATSGKTREKILTLHEGEFCIVPRGVEHKPVAQHECSVMLFEPVTTRNTGNVDHACTIEPDALRRI